MILLSSPTEPKTLTDRLAAIHDGTVETHSLPEKYGVDFAWRSNGRWWGVQRKELHDLLASFDDGRLAKEIAQMVAAIELPHLVIEGRIRVDTNDEVMTDGWGRGVSMTGLRKRLWTVASRGVHVAFTANMRDTATYITTFAAWSRSDGHMSSSTRPKPKNDWGKLTNRDYGAWLLQGLPDVGPKTAAAIIDTLGRTPVKVDATFEELCSVPGIGPKTARKILAINKGE